MITTRRMRSYLRGFGVRRRLLGSIILALVVFAILPETTRTTTRSLIAWNCGVALYVGLIAAMIMRSGIADIRKRAPLYDEAKLTILLLTLGAIAASFWAIVIELAQGSSGGRFHAAPILLAGVTVILSWTLTHLVFALHYAHEFYGPHPVGQRGGLTMPGGDEPDYADFVYTAFVIGCAAQTADVSFTSRPMRRIALIHGIVAFLFNTALLALTINIAATIVGNH
jgi:uncharacterized membrane protein